MNPQVYIGLEKDKQATFKETSPVQMIKAVCTACNVTEEQLKGLSKKRDPLEARYIAINLIMESNPLLTLKKVGAMFNRHHSTIVHSREVFDNLFRFNSEFRLKVIAIKELLCS